MRLAIGLFGIHYINGLNFWLGGTSNTDYKESLENNLSFFKNFKITDSDIETEITVFSSTYYSSKLLELIDDYNIKTLKLTNITNSSIGGVNTIQRHRRLKETIQLILDDENEYDFVILTRFDIFLKSKIYEFLSNIEEDKINVLVYNPTLCGQIMIDDNFYLLSYKILRKFYKQLNLYNEGTTSHQYCHDIGPDNFKIMCYDDSNIDHYEFQKTLYKITRKRDENTFEI
jgi:hypothetical protein